MLTSSVWTTTEYSTKHSDPTTYTISYGTADVYTTINDIPYAHGTLNATSTSQWVYRGSTTYSYTSIYTTTTGASFTLPTPSCSIPTSQCSHLWQTYLSSLGLPTKIEGVTEEPAITPMPSNRPRCSVGDYTESCSNMDNHGLCYIFGQNVELFYWPPTTSTASATNTIQHGNMTLRGDPQPVTAVYRNVTMTSPSVYLSLPLVSAITTQIIPDCYEYYPLGATKTDVVMKGGAEFFPQGATLQNVLVDLEPTSLSSLIRDFGPDINTASVVSEIAHGGLEFGKWMGKVRDVNSGAGNYYTSVVAQPFDYSNLETPSPAAYYLDPNVEAGCNIHGEHPECSTIFEGAYKPQLLLPDKVRKLDPNWATCLVPLYGAYDPPRALRPAASMKGALDGTTTPASSKATTTHAAPAQSAVEATFAGATTSRTFTTDPLKSSDPARPFEPQTSHLATSDTQNFDPASSQPTNPDPTTFYPTPPDVSPSKPSRSDPELTNASGHMSVPSDVAPIHSATEAIASNGRTESSILSTAGTTTMSHPYPITRPDGTDGRSTTGVASPSTTQAMQDSTRADTTNALSVLESAVGTAVGGTASSQYIATQAPIDPISSRTAGLSGSFVASTASAMSSSVEVTETATGDGQGAQSARIAYSPIDMSPSSSKPITDPGVYGTVTTIDDLATLAGPSQSFSTDLPVIQSPQVSQITGNSHPSATNSAMSALPLVTIGSYLYTLSTPAFPGGGAVIGSITLPAEGPATTLHGEIVSAATDGIVIGTSIFQYPYQAWSPAPVVTIGQSSYTAYSGRKSSEVIIGTLTTLNVDGPAATIEGHTISAVGGGLVIDGHTTPIASGGNKSGADTQTPRTSSHNEVYDISAADGGNAAVVDGKTLSVHGPEDVISGHTVTAVSGGILIDGQRFTYSAVLSSAATFKFAGSVETAFAVDGSRTALLHGTTLSMGGSALTSGGRTISIGPSGLIIEGGGGSTTAAFSPLLQSSTVASGVDRVTSTASLNQAATAPTLTSRPPAGDVPQSTSTSEADRLRAQMLWAFVASAIATALYVTLFDA